MTVCGCSKLAKLTARLAVSLHGSLAFTGRGHATDRAVILGLNQPLQYLADSFADASSPIVKGFMVGRTLWADASLKWFKGELGDAELINEVARNFAVLVDAWRNRHQALRAAA